MSDNEKYDAYVERMREVWGDRLDLSAIDERFVPFFRTGQRINVRLSSGEEVTGKVSAQPGTAKPVLTLTRRINGVADPDTLDSKAELIGVRHGRGYREIEGAKE